MTFSVRETLADLEANVARRVDELRQEIVPLERELADVRRAIAALTRESDGRMVAPTGDAASLAAVAHFRHRRFHGGGEAVHDAYSEAAESLYAKLTMKQLVKKALSEQFPEGAKATDLLEFFATAWGRTDIVRESLSPQLSRLKQDGLVRLDGLFWHLEPEHTEVGGLLAPTLHHPENLGTSQ